MAARENQGLQIALIVFVTLTVLLSVSTFFFLNSYKSEQKKLDDSEKKFQTASQDRAKMEGERNQLMQYLGGFATTEKIETVTDTWTKDMAAVEPLLPAKLPDDQKSYKRLADGLARVVRTQHTQLQQKDAALAAAKADFDQKNTNYRSDLANLTAAKDQALKEYMDEREKMKQQVDKLTELKTQLGASLGDKEKEAAEQKKQLDTKIASLESSLKNTETQLQLKADRVNEMSGRFSVNAQPDGEIVLANPRDNVVYINLGSADRLRKRITFSVFDRNTTDVSAIKGKSSTTSAPEPGSPPTSQATRKGVIEVINITQPHLAECRILENPSSQPLLQHDLIYTPLWDPGQQEHFALVGLLDIDGDGISDRRTIHDLIRTRGGIIDAETDEKGVLTGGVTFATRFLVKGDMAEKEGVNKEGPYKLIDEAKLLGVESVDLAKFLDMMGYSPLATVTATTTGRPPQPNLAGQPSSNFRTRTPPQRGNQGGLLGFVRNLGM